MDKRLKIQLSNNFSMCQPSYNHHLIIIMYTAIIIV